MSLSYFCIIDFVALRIDTCSLLGGMYARQLGHVRSNISVDSEDKTYFERQPVRQRVYSLHL